MKDLICSKDVREYVEKIGYEFSDIEKVVLIMQNGQSLTKQHQLLLELEKTTTDEKLKKKIRTKLNYDNKCIQEIQTSAPDGIFMLEVLFEDENDEGKIREYFILFDDAFNCALGAMQDFTISKIKLHRGKTQCDEDDFEDGIIEYIKYKEGEPVW